MLYIFSILNINNIYTGYTYLLIVSSNQSNISSQVYYAQYQKIIYTIMVIPYLQILQFILNHFQYVQYQNLIYVIFLIIQLFYCINIKIFIFHHVYDIYCRYFYYILIFFMYGDILYGINRMLVLFFNADVRCNMGFCLGINLLLFRMFRVYLRMIFIYAFVFF